MNTSKGRNGMRRRLQPSSRSTVSPMGSKHVRRWNEIRGGDHLSVPAKKVMLLRRISVWPLNVSSLHQLCSSSGSYLRLAAVIHDHARCSV